MMKRTIIWIISIIMIAGILLCGCGTIAGDDGAGTGQTEAGGMEIEISKTESPVKLVAKQVLSADENEGITTQAETTRHLSASVVPAGVVENAAFDYTCQWENEAAEWALEKDVSDYIEISQEEDGSGEADIICKQAFGEPIIISATLRNNEDMCASCKADYVEKILGVDYTMKAEWSGKTYAQWDFASESSPPSYVDFISLDSTYTSSYFDTYWNNKARAGTTVSMTPSYFNWSITNRYSICTKKIANRAFTYKVYVAATRTYLNALKTVSLSPAVSANQYIQISHATNRFSFGHFILGAFGAIPTFASYAQYKNLCSELLKVNRYSMLNIKIEIYNSDVLQFTQVYQVLFNDSSLEVQ